MEMNPISVVLYACTAITSISAAITVIIMWVSKAKAPNVTQNNRLDKLEAEMIQVKTMLDNDNQRFKEQERGNRVTQQALLALMSHAINGNDTDKLVEAKNKLEQYLIEK